MKRQQFQEGQTVVLDRQLSATVTAVWKDQRNGSVYDVRTDGGRLEVSVSASRLKRPEAIHTCASDQCCRTATYQVDGASYCDAHQPVKK